MSLVESKSKRVIKILGNCTDMKLNNASLGLVVTVNVLKKKIIRKIMHQTNQNTLLGFGPSQLRLDLII